MGPLATPTLAEDLVVLVDEAGTPIGTADRESVHGTDTPLHLAFSCHLRDRDGRVLLTRRALGKRSWPGVWTNAACGHLSPGEDVLDAARRRVPQELGCAIHGLRLALPDFRYRAVDVSGVVENEICPVMVGTIDADLLDPDPDEVAEWAWVDWPMLARLAATAPGLISPWSARQIVELGERPWG